MKNATVISRQQDHSGVMRTIYRHHDTGVFFDQIEEYPPKDFTFRLHHKWIVPAATGILVPMFCDSPRCGICEKMLPEQFLASFPPDVPNWNDSTS